MRVQPPPVLTRECGITVARVGVARLHRHHRPPPGGLVAFEALVQGWPRAWAIVGRAVSRVLDQRGWVEVTRVASDGAGNACSALYGAASRWARRHGRPVHTYTLDSEPGTSLRAAGWVVVGRTQPRRWSCASRPRRSRRDEANGKVRWCPRWVVDAGHAEVSP